MIVFDSSFLIGFHNQGDAYHESAKVLMERFLRGEWGRGLLLEYVFLEVATVLVLRRGLEVASRVGRLLLEAEELDFVPCSDLFAEAFQTLAEQGSTRLSFVDAAIAHLARQRTEGLVLTFDDEFRKAPTIRVPQP
jgi:predicted nucleic acid-binding protein